MVKFKPFKGTLYNKNKVEDFDKVVSQPYDKISPEAQKKYYQNSPYNVIRLIKNIPEKELDSYQTSAYYLQKWLKEGVLTKTDKDSFFYLEQTYSIFGKTYTRRAILGMGKLADYKENKIFPHEQTLKGPKLDRLELIRATQYNFGQIFMLYQDKEDSLNTYITYSKKEEYFSFTDSENVQHKLYVISEPRIVENISKFLEEKQFFIADGHHRYETALGFMKEQQEKNQKANNEVMFNSRLMSIVNAYDQGLIVLPTHRLLNNKLNYDYKNVIEKLEQFYKITDISLNNGLSNIHKLIRDLPEQSIYFYAQDKQDKLLLLKLHKWPNHLKNKSNSLKALDVFILHEIILKHILGMTIDDMENKTYLTYKRDPIGSIKEVQSKNQAMAFLMKPTDVDSVIRVAQDKETMPQKSTDFYPKMLTGYVFADIS